MRIHPNGIRPLRGLVRIADLSLRDLSTSWICPEGNIFPTKKPRISARLEFICVSIINRKPKTTVQNRLPIFSKADLLEVWKKEVDFDAET